MSGLLLVAAAVIAILGATLLVRGRLVPALGLILISIIPLWIGVPPLKAFFTWLALIGGVMTVVVLVNGIIQASRR